MSDGREGVRKAAVCQKEHDFTRLHKSLSSIHALRAGAVRKLRVVSWLSSNIKLIHFISQTARMSAGTGNVQAA